MDRRRTLAASHLDFIDKIQLFDERKGGRHLAAFLKQRASVLQQLPYRVNAVAPQPGQRGLQARPHGLHLQTVRPTALYREVLSVTPL